jgi:hypothetical protein
VAVEERVLFPFPQKGDADEEPTGGRGGIPPEQGDAVGLRHGLHPGKKIVEKSHAEVCGNGQGDQYPPGDGPHGGHLAEVDGQRFSSELEWRDPGKFEMNVFEKQVYRGNQVVPRQKRSYGRVIPDGLKDLRRTRGP